MASLPSAMDANGASRTTGGILHGWAQGNVFNHADVADQVHVGPHMGKVFVYQSPWVPDSKSSKNSIKCEVTPQLKPVLKTQAHLEACHTYNQMLSDGVWTRNRLTAIDLVELFVSKFFWHSHVKKYCLQVSNHPLMVE